jgi:hypothetical protein
VGAAACDAATSSVVACQMVGGCKLWQVATDCRASGLVCGTRSVVADCECPANTGQDFHADPAGGKAKGAAPFPTGLAAPPQCRFRSLGEALSAATAASTPALPARAVATGWSAATGADVVFAAEALPLVVPNGVKLATSDASPTVTHYHLHATVPGQPVVVLKEGAELSGFRIRTTLATGSSPSAAVVVGGAAAPCAAGAPAAVIRTLQVEAAGVRPMTSALTVGGGCAVEVSDALLQGAFTDGVVVSDTGTRALLHGVTVESSGKSGLVVQGGASVTFDVAAGGAAALRDNGEYGLKLAGGEAVVTGLPASRVDVARNGASGVLAGQLGAASRLTLRDASVHDNAAYGVDVQDEDATGAGLPMTLTGVALQANTLANLRVGRAGPAAGGAALVVDDVTSVGGKNGILVQPAVAGVPIHASFSRVRVSGASDGGIVVQQASGSVLSLTASTVSRNCAVTPYTTGRWKGGGLVFVGGLPTLAAFSGNTFSGNQYNQVLVASSVGSLALGAPSCAAANAFVCSGANVSGTGTVTGYGVASTSAPVAASFATWTADPPDSSRDFTGPVDPDGAGSDYCAPLAAACEPPPTSCP